MSSTATARGRAASGALRAAVRKRPERLRVSADVALGAGLAAGLTLVALLGAGGVDLGPNTWIEISLTALGAASIAWALLRGAAGGAWGGVTMVLMVALAALTFASISWSVQPADSWVEANRTLAYVGAFAGALALARLAPERWPALVGAVAATATILSGYALLVKVLPAALDPAGLLGRLSAPFDYWNATGLIAALGLPACLWAGARRERGPALRALSVPAIGILVAVLVLSYSRSALLVAVLGLGLWFALVPLRLRAALVLILGAAGGAGISLWALSKHQFTHDHASLQSRIAAGHALGLVLILALGALAIAGVGAARAIERLAVPAPARRRAGIVLVALLALIPAGGVAGLAGSSRGLSGEVAHVWSTLTSPRAHVGDNPDRLVSLGNTRPLYWSEGLKVGEHAPVKGTGALGYATARMRYVRDAGIVQHAHSYAIETFADFGLIGLALNLALLVAWAIAAARAVGARAPSWRRRPAPPAVAAPSAAPAPSEPVAERAGLLTLLVVVLVFGLQSAIDWTWFVPGTAVPALVCAGWLAGRGPLGHPIGRSPARKRVRDAPGAYGAAIALAAIALLAAWAIWQPLRSADAGAAATSAISAGNTGAALADARAAVARDPVSVQPLRELSAIYSASGEGTAARAALARATSVQPQNPATWQTLGELDLGRRQPQRALAELEVALRLDPSSPATLTDVARASNELRAGPGAAPASRSKS